MKEQRLSQLRHADCEVLELIQRVQVQTLKYQSQKLYPEIDTKGLQMASRRLIDVHNHLRNGIKQHEKNGS